MRTTGTGITFSLLVMTLAACGGAPPPTAAAAPSATGTVRPLTQAQLGVAHYRTADGVYGLVLDRSGPKPKYRLDGKSDIVELTMQEDRFADELRGYFLVAPDGKRVLWISTGGGVLYLHGSDELPLNSDKPADPLSAATVAGTYVAPPPAFKAVADRLTAIAVTTKLPLLTDGDSAQLSKVSDALGKATVEMFVHYVSHGATSWLPHPELVPEGLHGVEFGGVARESDDRWNPKAAGLAKYGGKNQGFSHYDTPQGNHMQVMKLAGYPQPLADNTPGIVWKVDGSSAVFVTLDGGRYVVDLSSADKGPALEAGAGPQSGWPPPVQNALLDVSDVSSLAKAGAVPQKAADDLLALDADWTACAAKTWATAQRAIDTGNFTEADRKDWEKKARTACAATIHKQEAMLVKIVEARIKERQALFATAKARIASLGADK
jgi:hypothetical protein